MRLLKEMIDGNKNLSSLLFDNIFIFINKIAKLNNSVISKLTIIIFTFRYLVLLPF